MAHSADLLTDAFCRAMGLVMAATVPASVLLAVLAEPFIRLVYGERWTGRCAGSGPAGHPGSAAGRLCTGL